MNTEISSQFEALPKIQQSSQNILLEIEDNMKSNKA